MNATGTLLRLLIVTLALAEGAMADARRWSDPQGQGHFWAAAVNQTWYEANRTCGQKGWDVFNIEYLSPEARERFLASPLMRELNWKTEFAGEPAERQVTSVWMSSEAGVIAMNGSGRSASVARLHRYAGEDAAHALIEYESVQDEGRLPTTVCMYLSRHWYGCSHEVRCEYTLPQGGNYAIRYTIRESGATEREAILRLEERAKDWKSEGGRCSLAVRDPLCIRER